LRDYANPFEGLTPREIYKRFRFPPNVILRLVDIISPALERPTRRGAPMPPFMEVCVFLRFVASAAFYIVVGDTLRDTKGRPTPASTVCRAIHRVARALTQLSNTYINFPGTNQRLVKEEFFDIAGNSNQRLYS
jgi:hypothetical protein